MQRKRQRGILSRPEKAFLDDGGFGRIHYTSIHPLPSHAARHTSQVTQLATAAWAGSLDSSSKELALPGSSRLRESQCTEGTVRITGIAAGTSLNLRVSPSTVAAGPLFAPAGVSVVSLTVFPTQSRGSDQLRLPPFGENTRTRLGDSRVGSVFGAPGDGGSTAGRFQQHGSTQYARMSATRLPCVWKIVPAGRKTALACRY